MNDEEFSFDLKNKNRRSSSKHSSDKSKLSANDVDIELGNASFSKSLSQKSQNFFKAVRDSMMIGNNSKSPNQRNNKTSYINPMGVFGSVVGGKPDEP